MFKKLALLSVMLSLGACETINQASQCEPEKNYEYTNIELMEKYKNDYANSEIKSIYYETLPAKYCNDTSCTQFNSKKINFIEKNFDDNNRKGIYTIYKINDLSGNCLKETTADFNNKDKYCFILNKNDNNIIKSKFKFSVNNDNKRTLIQFKNIMTNEILYEVSYQVYSTGAIGGPGYSYCKAFKNNNPHYKFNSFAFPTNN